MTDDYRARRRRARSQDSDNTSDEIAELAADLADAIAKKRVGSLMVDMAKARQMTVCSIYTWTCLECIAEGECLHPP